MARTSALDIEPVVAPIRRRLLCRRGRGSCSDFASHLWIDAWHKCRARLTRAAYFAGGAPAGLSPGTLMPIWSSSAKIEAGRAKSIQATKHRAKL